MILEVQAPGREKKIKYGEAPNTQCRTLSKKKNKPCGLYIHMYLALASHASSFV